MRYKISQEHEYEGSLMGVKYFFGNHFIHPEVMLVRACYRLHEDTGGSKYPTNLALSLEQFFTCKWCEQGYFFLPLLPNKDSSWLSLVKEDPDPLGTPFPGITSRKILIQGHPSISYNEVRCIARPGWAE